MSRTAVSCLLSLIALDTSCATEFTCLVDADCAIFSGANVCDQRNADGVGQCYAKKPTTGPRRCDSGVPLSSKTPSDSANFGVAIAAAEGKNVLVGASFQAYTMTGTTNGNAEIFSYSSSDKQWKRTALFTSPPANDQIGIGVSLSKDKALVNARNNSYLFSKLGDDWSSPQGPTALLPLGAAGSFQNGALLTDNFTFAGYGHQAGASAYETYIYTNMPTPCGNTTGAVTGFGDSLAFQNNSLFVGSAGDTNNPGQVCVVDTSAGCKMGLACTVLPRKLPAQDQFGKALAISGGKLIVGAPKQTVKPFFVYESDRSGWILSAQQPDPLPAPTPTYGWGTSISADGDLVAIGGVDAGNTAGAVLLFQLLDGKWAPAGELDPMSVGGFNFPQGGFGYSVAVSGDLVVVGAPTTLIPNPAGGSPIKAGAVMVYSCPHSS